MVAAPSECPIARLVERERLHEVDQVVGTSPRAVRRCVRLPVETRVVGDQLVVALQRLGDPGPHGPVEHAVGEHDRCPAPAPVVVDSGAVADTHVTLGPPPRDGHDGRSTSISPSFGPGYAIQRAGSSSMRHTICSRPRKFSSTREIVNSWSR